MKPFLFILLSLLGLKSINAQQNQIQIVGNTNINSFKCTNDSFRSNEKLQLNKAQLPNIVLKVDDFDCQNKTMTRDFQKTLSSDKHPQLTIKFLKVTKTNGGYNSQVQVGIMDKTKTYQVNFNTNKGLLIGKKQVRFSDFGINPPKKMGGMIVVKDELNLLFSFPSEF